MTITNATKLTTLIGHPVTSSLSPILHNAVYEREKIDAIMLAFGNPAIEPLVAAMRALPIHLAAVTMPHKQSIMPLLDEIDAEARAIGAVNTVVNREGKLIGYNTDIHGVAAALEGVELRGKNVLLVGAGGAARTVAYLLKREGATIFCKNRERGQAEELVGSFGGAVVDDSSLGSSSYTVIINATPIGMSSSASAGKRSDAMPVPEELIRPETAVFDLVYSPLETKLIDTARAKGAKAISGLVMFLEQGLEQERLWLGKEIDPAPYAEILEAYVR